jgi:hypothetical protein
MSDLIVVSRSALKKQFVDCGESMGWYTANAEAAADEWICEIEVAGADPKAAERAREFQRMLEALAAEREGTKSGHVVRIIAKELRDCLLDEDSGPIPFPPELMPDDRVERCDMATGRHVMPHRGCPLR